MTKSSAKPGGTGADESELAADDLGKYRAKRDPAKTTEPFESSPKDGSGETFVGAFVVHLHDARRRHYDLRIQIGSALTSFAVPRGPSLDPADKRLAVQTEAHPLDYLDFEDVIPEGLYGAGPMIAWDIGRVAYQEGSAEEGLKRGDLKIELFGHKLKGRFAIVETSRRSAPAPGRAEQPQWLLIKKQDAFSQAGVGITEARPRSVLSGLTISELGQKAEVGASVEQHAAEAGATKADVDVKELVPMLCATTDPPFGRAGWIYELKLDGVRIIADKSGDSVALRYRSRRGATLAYPEIARAVRSLAAERVVLDGEIVAFDGEGRPNFQRLARRIHVGTPFEVKRASIEVPVVYLAFDMLAIGGRDLRSLPLLKRKELLQELVRGDGLVRTLDHIEDGEALYKFCGEQEIEGVVAKKAASRYRPGPDRSEDWIKVKREREADFVVVGWIDGRGGRGDLGSIEVASWSGERLVHRGRVGSGFDHKELRAMLERVQSLETDASPAEGDVMPTTRTRHFTRPELVVSVAFSGWGESGHLRHPRYRGLRADMDPRKCVGAPGVEVLDVPPPLEETEPAVASSSASEPVHTTRVALTNQDKVFWPDEGFTKGQLCEYYAAISDTALPFLKDRPVMLVRYPDGINGKNFYQWRPPRGTPDWIRTFQIKSEEHDGKNVSVFIMDNAEALLHIANLGCIPLHILASRIDSLTNCDFLTVDFDLAGNPFRYAVQLALTLKETLEELGFVGYPKTSGQTGMHVLIPVGPGVPFAAAKMLLELIGRLVLVHHTDIATMERRKERRDGKVLIDIGQTGRSRTIVSPYSVRATAGARVSAPLFWDEVHLALDPARFDMFSMPGRAAEIGDPLEGMLEQRPDVPQAIAKMEKILKR